MKVVKTSALWLFVGLLFSAPSRGAFDPGRPPAFDPPRLWRQPGEGPPRLHEPGVREEWAATSAQGHRARKQAAWDIAASQGWEPWGQTDQTVYELMSIKGGWVCVLKTQNVTAANAVAVDKIRAVAPYDLTGIGQTVAVWDAGVARPSHREFKSRVSIGDRGRIVSHSTHITGTICAAGVDARALGMAPAVQVDCYDFDEDLAEATLRAMSYANEPGMIQISNHSYGWVCGWDYSTFLPRWYGTWGARESDMFGGYDSSARDWDVLCYAAPYYLPFKATGNDRGDPAPAAGTPFEYYSESRGWMRKSYNASTDPLADGWDRGGYDTLTPDATAKNVLTVGAVDLSAAGGRNLSRVAMTTFSGWGPTDDGRVKPDLVTHGVNLYSTTADSDHSYGTASGTSMATAVASGTAALLCEYYDQLFPRQALRSATLKALLIHTADDLGSPGPDYCYGWGLVNAQAAADHLQSHASFPNAYKVVEDAVDASAKTRSYQSIWDGSSPIRATLAWTDPPAAEVEGLDNRSTRLVNDLDLRVVGPDGSIYTPFVLDPARPDVRAGTGDNTLDNVEQVLIATPRLSGRYYARVTYKGSLTDGQQEYSLLLSGQQASQAALADMNGDGLVDWLDVQALTRSWLNSAPASDVVPSGGDGIINWFDFAELARELTGN
jgi:subtilisin family serine protease